MSRVEFTVCPFCGYECDMSSAVEKPAGAVEPRMKPGSASMCIRCGGFSIMGRGGMLRRPKAHEVEWLDANPLIRDMRRAWAATVGRRRIN